MTGPDFGFSPVANRFRAPEGFSLVLDRYELRRGESFVATVQVSEIARSPPKP